MIVICVSHGDKTILARRLMFMLRQMLLLCCGPLWFSAYICCVISDDCFLFLLIRCSVWNNNGSSLTFHIPSTDNKGTVKVCVLLHDGSCHGNAKVTYQSLPSCTNISPNTSWIRYDSSCCHCCCVFPTQIYNSGYRIF